MEKDEDTVQRSERYLDSGMTLLVEPFNCLPMRLREGALSGRRWTEGVREALLSDGD